MMLSIHVGNIFIFHLISSQIFKHTEFKEEFQQG